MTKRRLLVAILLLALLVTAAWLAVGHGPRLPPGLSGAIAFVSDRDGIQALYWRRLPRDRERRLTLGSERRGHEKPNIAPPTERDERTNKE